MGPNEMSTEMLIEKLNDHPAVVDEDDADSPEWYDVATRELLSRNLDNLVELLVRSLPDSEAFADGYDSQIPDFLAQIEAHDAIPLLISNIVEGGAYLEEMSTHRTLELLCRGSEEMNQRIRNQLLELAQSGEQPHHVAQFIDRLLRGIDNTTNVDAHDDFFGSFSHDTELDGSASFDPSTLKWVESKNSREIIDALGIEREHPSVLWE